MAVDLNLMFIVYYEIAGYPMVAYRHPSSRLKASLWHLWIRDGSELVSAKYSDDELAYKASEMALVNYSFARTLPLVGRTKRNFHSGYSRHCREYSSSVDLAYSPLLLMSYCAWTQSSLTSWRPSRYVDQSFPSTT